MPYFRVKTFFCMMCFRDRLDGASPRPLASSVFLCISEERVLRIFDGEGLNHWVFAVDPIPQEPLFTIDLKRTTFAFDFRRVISARGNHILGRMRITGDFGTGLERLIFKLPMIVYEELKNTLLD